MRQLGIWSLTLVWLLGCARSAPAPEALGRDAADGPGGGPANVAPSPSLPSQSTLSLLPDAAAPWQMRGLWKMPPQRRHASHHIGVAAAPDSRVAGCIAKQLPAWTDFEVCVRAADGYDAGTHRVGALQPPIVCPAAAVTTWYVNPSTGNDKNTCVDSSHQCATKAQIDARNGCGGSATDAPALVVPVVINLTADTTECMSAHPRLMQGSASSNFGNALTILGQMITVTTGSIVTVTQAKNRALNHVYNVDLGAAAAASVGLYMHDTARSSRALVDAIVSGTVVRLSQPVDDADDATELDTLTGGDPVVIERDPAVCFSDGTASVQGGSTDASTPAWSTLALQNLHIVNTGFAGGALSFTSLGDLGFLGRSIVDSNLTLRGFVLAYNNKIAILDATGSTGVSPGVFVANGIVDDLHSFKDGFIGNDVIVHQDATFTDNVGYDYLYLDATASTPVNVLGTMGPTGAGMIYGAWGFRPGNSPATLLVYTGPNYPGPDSAALAFPGLSGFPTWQATNTVYAVDRGCTSLPIYAGRAVTLSSIDSPIGGPGGTGFAGIVYGASLNPVIVSFAALHTAVAPVPCLNGVPLGGTGIATCLSGAVLLGNGTGPLNCLGPGTAGNVLTSVGGVWASAPLPASGCSSLSSCPGTVPIASLAGCGTNNQILQTVGGVQTCETVSGVITLIGGVAALVPTGVTAGTYGNSTNVGQFQVNAGGQIVAATNVPVSGGVSCPVNLATCSSGISAHAVLVGTPVVGVIDIVHNNFALVSQTGLDPAFGPIDLAGIGVAGTLPITELGHGSPGDTLFTGASIPVWAHFRSTNSGGPSASDISCGNTPAVCTVQGFAGIPFVGGVTAGNVLTVRPASASVGFDPPPVPALPASGFNTAHTIPVGASCTIVNVVQANITVPTGGCNVQVTIAFKFINPDSGTFGAVQNVIYGLGVDTGLSFSDSDFVTIPFDISGLFTPQGGATEVWEVSLGAGAHVIHGMAQVCAGVGVTAGANINIHCVQ
jgi:hypothetical protein